MLSARCGIGRRVCTHNLMASERNSTKLLISAAIGVNGHITENKLT